MTRLEELVLAVEMAAVLAKRYGLGWYVVGYQLALLVLERPRSRWGSA